MAAIWLTATALICSGPTYALDNGVIHIEVEPRLFAVRFIGLKDKVNFVATLAVDASIAAGNDWADPGGLQTDLVPYTGKDAATRRGPAEVVEYRSDYIAMLGPPSETTGIRLKKEIQLDGASPRAHFRVTAQQTGTKPVKRALRNTVRLPEKCTVRLERTDGDIRVLAGTDAIVPEVVKSRRYWLIPIPPTKDMRGVMLGAATRRMIVVNDSGTWTRILVNPAPATAGVPNTSTFLCVLDSPTRSYGASLQGETTEMKTGDLVSLEEEWIFEKRGK